MTQQSQARCLERMLKKAVSGGEKRFGCKRFAFTCCTGDRGSSNWRIALPIALQQITVGVELNRGSARVVTAHRLARLLEGLAAAESPWLHGLSGRTTLLCAYRYQGLSSCSRAATSSCR
jgi:hypothetical protein